MKLDLNSMPKEKQKLLIIAVVAVVVLVGGYFAYSTFFAGSGAAPTDMSASAPPAAPADGGVAGGATPPAGAPPAATPPAGAPPAGAPSAGAPAPGAAPTPAPGSAPSGPTTSAPAPTTSKPSASQGSTKSITVFGTITVTYPAGWGIDMRSAGSSAVLTDGRGRFELRPPDPKAANAKAIADSVKASVAKGAKVISQGATKIGSNDAFFYNLGSMRIVGIDASTRIALVETVKGGQMASYKPTFDKMEAGLSFR